MGEDGKIINDSNLKLERAMNNKLKFNDLVEKYNKELYDDIFSDEYNIIFDKITGLSWYPFVGKNYSNSSIKMLVIGESHYASNDKSVVWGCDKYFTLSQDYNKNATIDNIIESQFNHEWEARTYCSLNRMISGIEYCSTQSLWKEISYYNLIQALMPNNGVRPRIEDWELGVKTFFSVVEILKPDVCLFLGTSSKDFFQNQFEYTLYDRISNVIPVSFKLKLKYKECLCIQIRHPGAYFSWEKWRNFILGFSQLRDLCDKIAILNLDNYEITEKDRLYQSFLKQIKDFENYEPLSNFETYKIEGTEYWGFHLKGNDEIRLAFNFWESGYRRLTGGLYSPNSIFKQNHTDYKNQGYEKNSNWIYYEFYPAYIWKNYEFDMIKNGVLKKIIAQGIKNILSFAEKNKLI